ACGGVTAVIVVELTTFTLVAGIPSKVTLVAPVRPVPVSVRPTPPDAEPEVGLMAVNVEPETYVNPLVSVARPLDVRTATSTTPGARLGASAVTVVALTTVTPEAARPPNVTDVAVVRFVPVKVIGGPNEGPDVGATDVNVANCPVAAVRQSASTSMRHVAPAASAIPWLQGDETGVPAGSNVPVKPEGKHCANVGATIPLIICDTPVPLMKSAHCHPAMSAPTGSGVTGIGSVSPAGFVKVAVLCARNVAPPIIVVPATSAIIAAVARRWRRSQTPAASSSPASSRRPTGTGTGTGVAGWMVSRWGAADCAGRTVMRRVRVKRTASDIFVGCVIGREIARMLYRTQRRRRTRPELTLGPQRPFYARVHQISSSSRPQPRRFSLN